MPEEFSNLLSSVLAAVNQESVVAQSSFGLYAFLSRVKILDAEEMKAVTWDEFSAFHLSSPWNRLSLEKDSL